MTTGWYFGLDNQVVGPVDLQQLLDFLGSSEQWRRVLVWHEGFDEWKPAKDIPEIAAHISKGPPPLPAPVPEISAVAAASVVPNQTPGETPTSAPQPAEPVIVQPVAAEPVVVEPVIAPAEALRIAELKVAEPDEPAEPPAKAQRRRGWSAAVAIVIALSAAAVVGHYTGRRNTQTIASAPATAALATPAAPEKATPSNDAVIESGFAGIVLGTAPTLPKKLDDWTVMYDVTSSGRRMTYHQTLDTTKYLVPPNFAAMMKQKVLADACSGAMREAVKAGGSIEYRYHTQALFFVGSFEVVGNDCPSAAEPAVSAAPAQQKN